MNGTEKQIKYATNLINMLLAQAKNCFVEYTEDMMQKNILKNDKKFKDGKINNELSNKRIKKYERKFNRSTIISNTIMTLMDGAHNADSGQIIDIIKNGGYSENKFIEISKIL